MQIVKKDEITLHQSNHSVQVQVTLKYGVQNPYTSQLNVYEIFLSEAKKHIFKSL